MTTGERIRERRKEIDMSAERLASLIGVSAATIYRYENGDIEKVPGDFLSPIASALRTTPAHLMGWEDKTSIFSLPGIQPLPRTVRKPRLGTIACGEPILCEENLDGYDDVPESIHCDFTLKCKGDSMIGARIHDGDIVYIRQQEAVENGEIAAVLIDGTETTLKRVYCANGLITLQAENPAFAPIVVTSEHQFSVLGKAVGFTSVIK